MKYNRQKIRERLKHLIEVRIRLKDQLREAWFAAVAEWKEKAEQEARRQVREYSQKKVAELWGVANKDRYQRNNVQISVDGPRVSDELGVTNADINLFRRYLQLLVLTDDEDVSFTGPLRDLPKYL